jgi:hypothetical protein
MRCALGPDSRLPGFQAAGFNCGKMFWTFWPVIGEAAEEMMAETTVGEEERGDSAGSITSLTV